MAGKIFYRERRTIGKGDKKARYTVAAVVDLDIDFVVEHFKRHELEQIAAEVGAELVLLEDIKESDHYLEKP